MTVDYIVDVDETDFEYEVVAYSKQMPVIVDFWAEWCGPCKILGPILEKVADESQGIFRLAKVNVDDNPNLSQQYGVRSIPFVKAFRDGLVVGEFVGAQPESRIREFIRGIAPSETDLTLEKAISLLAEHEWLDAEHTFQEYLESNPDSPTGLLGLAKCYIMQGKSSKAIEILNYIRPSKEYSLGEIIKPLAYTLENIQRNDPIIEDDLEMTYQHSLRLINLGNIPAAMDGLLDILRQDKNFRDGEVKRIMLSLFEILGNDHEISRQYRNEFASVIF